MEMIFERLGKRERLAEDPTSDSESCVPSRPQDMSITLHRVRFAREEGIESWIYSL